MEKFNLFLMDMSSADNTSGVDRYMGLLMAGLKQYRNIRVCRIHLVHDNSKLFHSEISDEGYSEVTIPLPQRFNEIISQKFWMQKYNEHVFHLLAHLFDGKQRCILHLHTLNLIDLALYIKKQHPCKIITHLHCIPWKDLYNKNSNRFNFLYRQAYLNERKLQTPRQFLCVSCEMQSYEDADQVVCVTKCAKKFLKSTLQAKTPNIAVIPNGISDYLGDEGRASVEKKASDTFQCLYVGVVTKSKGLDYILTALRMVQARGYKASLVVAGKCAPLLYEKISRESADLNVKMLGRIPFEELKKYYLQSDIGLIASVQEQSSYGAIEMAMFGLPIIATAVDGLDEMFEDGVNALKVRTLFSTLRGLSVDTNMLADKIVLLIENGALRRQLSENVRKLYEDRFTLNNMVRKTVAIYSNMAGGVRA
jgi:glycosyltransferase involved in cell wall biosynthesis